mgnify:FL=1
MIESQCSIMFLQNIPQGLFVTLSEKTAGKFNLYQYHQIKAGFCSKIIYLKFNVQNVTRITSSSYIKYHEFQLMTCK